MKINPKHFKFDVKSRRFKASVWAKYYELKKKKALTEPDKYWMRQMRASLKTNQFKLVGTHVPTKTSHEWTVKKDLSKERMLTRDYITNLIDAVQLGRKNLKLPKVVNRHFDGANYATIGGVFSRKGIVLSLGQYLTTNDPMSQKKPRHATKNYIGIELEFNKIPNGPKDRDIAAKLKDAGLARYVDVGEDGSCGWEVRVLLLESEFEPILTKILAVLTSMGFNVDNRCGTHVHIDMRNRDVRSVYANMFKTQMFLRKFLTRNRKYNEYCKRNKAPTFDEQTAVGDRRYAINTQAYAEHKTIEVRMHQGSLQASILIPWINLLIKIANYKGVLTKSVGTLKQAKNQFDMDSELTQDLQERIMSMFTNKTQTITPSPVRPRAGISYPSAMLYDTVGS